VSDICTRIDTALELARWRYPEAPVKAIYLRDEDWEAFNQAMRKDWPTAAATFSYRDVQIFKAKSHSIVATKGGCSVCIPKRLSARVRKAA
jgi:hypothetical protein